MALEDLLGALTGQPALLTSFVEQVPGGVAFFDEQGRPVLHNVCLVQILGSVPATVQDVVFVTAEGRELDAASSPIARALAGQPVTAEPLRVVSGDVQREVIVTALPVRTAGAKQGPIVGGLLLLVDASARRRAEILQREVMGVVGHDLRNPLAAIRMTAQLMGKPDEMTTERRVTLAKRVVTSSGRMDALVRTLLDFARAHDGALVRLDRAELDLAALVHRVVEEQQQAFPGRPIQEELRGGLKPGDPLLGNWDATRIEQIVTALVTNALRYGDEGPVTVTLESAANEARLSVHNSGPSIPAEVLPRLFEPFELAPRAPGAPRRSIGLGLFIVNRFVTAHGGTVTGQSSETGGTKFTVVLPRNPPPEVTSP
jgi:signal transduction histidine kinase